MFNIQSKINRDSITMKKKYIIPEEEVLELKYQSVLCASDPMDEEEQPEQGGGGGGIMP